MLKVGDHVTVNKGTSYASCKYAGMSAIVTNINLLTQSANVNIDILGGGVHLDELVLFNEQWDK